MTSNSSAPVLEHRGAKTEGANPLSTEQATERPSLDMLIRIALRASSSPDPRESIDTVMGSIDPDDYAYYLRQAVVARLSSAVTQERAANTPRIREGVSTKQSLIRDQYWPQFLQQRVFIGDHHKFLGDATSGDLRAVAMQRRQEAAEHTMRAKQFDALARLMDFADVRTLKELDESAGLEMIGRAA